MAAFIGGGSSRLKVRQLALSSFKINKSEHHITLLLPSTPPFLSTLCRRRAMSSASPEYKKVLTLDTINPHVKNVEYAVRGELSNKATEYSDMLSQGKGDLPFKSVVSANIGNPQQQPYLAQKPLTFWRQVC